MALILVADRVQETTSTTGTGTLSLSGAVSDYQTFVAGVGSGNQTYYSISGGGQWETGIGTVTSGSPDTLSRDTVLASSNSDSAVSFSAGSKTVSCAILAARGWPHAKLNDGSAAAPTATFLNETDTGVYRVSGGGLGLSVGGTTIMTCPTSDAMTFTPNLLLTSGQHIAPPTEHARLWVPGQNIGGVTHAGEYAWANTFGAKYSSGWKSTASLTPAALTIDEGRFAFFAGDTTAGADEAITWRPMLKFDTTEFVVNDHGMDRDFRVESAGTTHMLFVDAGNSAVGINQASPAAALDIVGSLIVSGSVSKGSGSFRIPHPLKPGTHDLVHSFVESPRADNIYRGVVDLVGGTAVVDLDTASGMSAGTFVALNRDPQALLQNLTGYTPVKAVISGASLSITAEDPGCTDEISWLVIAERQDDVIKSADWTDSTGRPIIEPERVGQTTEADGIYWSITSMDHVLADGGVVGATWRARAVNNGHCADHSDTCKFDYDPLAAGFIPFADLQESDVLQWVFACLDGEKAGIEDRITASADAKRLKAETYGKSLPWGESA